MNSFEIIKTVRLTEKGTRQSEKYNQYTVVADPRANKTQIKQAVDESMRGGFTLHVTQVRENRAYLDSRHIEVPWSSKELDLKWTDAEPPKAGSKNVLTQFY